MDDAFPFDCSVCGNEWWQHFQLPMEMQAMAKAVKKVRCPKCDAGGKSLKVNFRRDAAPADEPNK